MFTAAEKSSSTTPPIRQKPGGTLFFRKAGNEGFFGANEKQAFFQPSVQPKLEVSQPDDPQEKEADAMADKVMRMAEPEAAAAGERQDEQTGTPGLSVQRQIQSEDKETVSAKQFASISRQAGPGGFASHAAPDEEIGGTQVQAKAFPDRRATYVMRSARGPPAAPATHHGPSFEQSLASSRGAGMPLPDDARRSMESRFGADFSGVRIHTGSGAEGLSRSIDAQAFTHGGDIYFNSGKYSPNTASGSLLLAHELTHTIQQGASSVRPKSIAQRSIQRKEAARPVQRQAETQRHAAVELAKAEVGKVSANQEGPDGKRMGWERLLEYFQTTFGPDKILPEGAAYQRGHIGEGQIKVKSTFYGAVPGSDGVTPVQNRPRDAMPSWCGIFAFWALNKGGIPLKKWHLGSRMIPPEAAYPPGHMPQAGDIAYRQEFSHYALVAGSSGDSVTSVNGNTAGEDNLGGEIQVHTHPRNHWFAFFNPTALMEGSLRNPGAPDAPGAAPVRSLGELRKRLFNVQRKPGGDLPAPSLEREEQVQAKSADKGPGIAAPAVEALPAPAVQRSPALSPSAPSPSALSPTVPESAPKEGDLETEREQAPHSGGFEIHRSREGSKLAGSGSPVPIARAGEDAPRAAAEEFEAGSASSPTRIAQRQPMSLHNRGPPRAPPAIPLLGRKLIQRSWLGDAWSAVSGFVGEAAQWIERGLDAAKEWLLRRVRDFVGGIPGYRMLCLILGEDPITGEAAPSTGATLLDAGLELLPLGGLFRSLMRRLGVYNDVATWLQGRIGDLGALASGVSARFARFWDRLSLDDIGDPQDVMNRVSELLRGALQDIGSFVGTSAATFLDMIKRVMVREIAGFVRRRIPGIYPLLCVALGFDPETMQDVPRNGTNILNAFLEVSEAGREQRRQMQETGTFQRIAGWVDRGIAVFSAAYALLKQAIAGIWDFVTVENLSSPVETFTRIWDRFSAPVTMVGGFLIVAAIEILKVIKEVLMRRLSEHARETRGFGLVCVIIGKDPFTDQVVPRTTENLVKGFMGLMEGGEQQYEQLKESGAIDRILQKVERAVARLNMTPQAVVQLFIDLWNSFSIDDLAHPIDCFRRIVATFGGPILRLIAFVIEIILIVVEAILILMSFPFDLIRNIIAKVILAYEMIKRDPVGFFKNLLRAIKQGFIQFFDNIGAHLLNGVVGWLMSELRDAGVPVFPQPITLQGVIGWVLQVLGISMEAIWRKLSDHPRIGPARVARLRSMIDTLDGIWTFIRDVQERGMAAIWERIQEQLSSLWDRVLDAAKNWILDRIIQSVVTRLLSMLDPTGIMAVVNSALAVYRAIQSFIRYVTQMLQVVNSFVEGVVEIASGNITRAANCLEDAMDRAMPVVIGFLANQVGLGGIGARIAEIIASVRQLVDRALTWLVNRAVETGMSLFNRLMAMGRSAVASVTEWWRSRKDFTSRDGAAHHLYFRGTGAAATLIVESDAQPVAAFLNRIEPKVNEPANAAMRVHYDQAVSLDQQVNTLKIRLANVANYPNPATRDTDRQSDSTLVEQRILDLSGKLSVLLPLLSGPVPPPAVLPAFTNGVCASPVDAQFISTNTPRGQSADANSGSTMPGWNSLNEHLDSNGRSIRARDNYVKMHILHDQLGGRASDSNLAPCKSTYNTRFYNELERSAVAYKNSGTSTNPTVLWYRVVLDFHPANVTSTGADPSINYSPYLSAFTASFGHITFNSASNQWNSPGAAVSTLAISSIAVPDFSGGIRIFEMNADGTTAMGTMRNGATALPRPYAQVIVNERNYSLTTGERRNYANFADMNARLAARQQANPRPDYSVGQSVLSAMNGQGKLRF